MNSGSDTVPAERHLADAVESAARAAGCPIGVFYVCGKRHFEVASVFGCRFADAVPFSGLAVLRAARDQSKAVTVLHEAALAHHLRLASHWLFSAETGPPRFAAAVHVAFGEFPSCGLLLVADQQPRAAFPKSQQYMLQANAARISELLEYQANRQTQQHLRHAPISPAPDPSAPHVDDARMIDHYRQRAGHAEAATLRLDLEKAALEDEIQERKRIESRLHYLAFHDNLTAVHNRQFFVERLAAALDRLTIEPNFHFGVLLLDLDGFKTVNDSLGHRAGDLMLIEIAERLTKSVRADDIVARIGGDEFAILVHSFDKQGYVASMAARVVEVVRHPIELDGQEVYASASIGAALASNYYRLPEELLRDADMAMYEAKRRRAGFLIFDDSMRREAVISAQFRSELRRAVVLSEFYTEYQPIFNLATNEIEAMEALIRWQHPKRGKLLPAEFIRTAEEMGLIREIGTQLLREACKQMQQWHLDFPNTGTRLNVNISGHQLTDAQFIPKLDEILAHTGLDPALLQLEVRENVVFPSSEPTIAVLNTLRALRVRIVLDHFGTGYSSFGDLENYPIDGIKIDRSFVAAIFERQTTLGVLKAIIALAQALGIEVTAEGVEQHAQSRALLAAGCTQAQGYALCKPLSAAAAGNLLLQHATQI